VVPGGQQAVGQGAVIGEQEQALGVLVQPSRREEPHPAQMLGQQLQHGGLAGVLRRGHQPRRLVEHQVNQPLPGNRFAVHLKAGRGVVFPVRRLGRHAVHGHPAGPHQLPRLFSGPPACIGQNFIQPLHRLLLWLVLFSTF